MRITWYAQVSGVCTKKEEKKGLNTGAAHLKTGILRMQMFEDHIAMKYTATSVYLGSSTMTSLPTLGLLGLFFKSQSASQI